MFNQFQVHIQHKSRQRSIINALLTLITGVLTLIFPSFLYLIAGAYLVSLGLMFMVFKFPSPLVALPLVSGILIFIFPDLIPFTFASFLGLFGLAMLFALQLSILGVISLVIAVLILMNPDSVAYFIAFFMLVYSVSNLISFYNNRKDSGDGFDDDSVTIE